MPSFGITANVSACVEVMSIDNLLLNSTQSVEIMPEARARSLSRTGAPKRSSFSFFYNAKSSWSSKSCMGRSKGAKAKASMSNSGNFAAIR